MALQKSAHQLRQQVLGRDGGSAKGQLAFLPGGGKLLQCLTPDEDILGHLIGSLSLGSQPHPAPGSPVDQPDIQLLLQGADMGTDGGLGQKQLLRRPCEAGAVRRGDEGLQLFQIDIYHNITFLFP